MEEQSNEQKITIGDNESIYPIFEKFIDTTVLQKTSLITVTDNDENIFNVENIRKIMDAYIDNLDDGEGSFEEKIKKQIEQIKDDKKKDVCKHIITNLLYLRDLPNEGISKRRKLTRINPFGLELKNDPFDLQGQSNNKNEEESEKLLFPTEGIATFRTDRSTHSDFAELILLYCHLFEEDNDFGQIKEKIKKWVLDRYKESENSSSPIDHMLLHLCDPITYSTTSSLNLKRKIARNLYKLYVKDKEFSDENLKFENVDGTLKEIYNNLVSKRSEYEKERWSDVFWMDKDIKSQWQGGYVANAYEILTQYQKQVILYGAPGTGKTYSAEQIIKEFIYDASKNGSFNGVNIVDYQYKENDKKDDLDSVLKDKEVIWEMVQFNQSYSYEDFIEGMRPTEKEGLVLVDGIFKRFCNVASLNPGKKFIFVIDEINRGKIDKIFGELLYLLEYRDKEILLHYSNNEFSIPNNVYIIGTMNTADKSIALLDVALRRRFWFVRCAPQRAVLLKQFGITITDRNKITIDENDDPQNVKNMAVVLFDWLNGDDKKSGRLDSLGSDADELKIGHSYFLKLIPENKDQESITFSDLKNIWFYSIVPLIEEYCGFDKTRVEELLKIENVNLSKEEGFTLKNLKSVKKWN